MSLPGVQSSTEVPSILREARRPALIIGHPGHELKVFGWLTLAQPRVFVLSDGSGSTGTSRLASTETILRSAQACCGEIFGVWKDQEIYRLVLERNIATFLRVADELTHWLLFHEIDLVVGDAHEGYNPTHDLCRALINTSIRAAHRTSGAPIGDLQLALADHEDAHEHHDRYCHHLMLSDELLERKIQALQGYRELRAEVEQAAQRGVEVFRLECFRGAGECAATPAAEERPYYEIWGEARVKRGVYQQVIRYRQHMLPILEALAQHQATAEAGLQHATQRR